MSWFYALMKKIPLCFLLAALLTANLPLNVYAESGSVDTSVAATAGNVVTVQNLASALKTANPSSVRTGHFTWDIEGKSRSWTYYNGIMMDAYLMLDSSKYTSYVDAFYNANIGTREVYKPDKYNISCGYVDNTSPATDNYYRPDELDSIPPTRALFDLIRSNSDYKDKYIKMIDYVYYDMQNYPPGVVKDTDGNFKHKSGWDKYYVALDGLYMAQPFFMELANALDDKTLRPEDFSKCNISDAEADSIYTAVSNRMIWVGNCLYNSDTGLYNHGWDPKNGVNGQYWLRAIGWYAAALVDVISMLPDDYASQKSELIRIEKQLFDGMIEEQDVSGLWLNVLRYPPSNGNRLETSGSALMAYAMMKAYAEDQVDEDKYGDAGLRAFNGIVSGYVSNDALGNVYRSSGASASAEDYMIASLYVVNEAKGVGPLMMAAVYANDAAEKYNRPKPHVHEWQYSSDGSILTVTCNNTDGGHSGEISGTMTLTAPDHAVYGDGKEAAATISGSIEGVSTPTIIYKNGDATLTEPPVNAGTYIASIVLGGAKAEITYTVAPKHVKITGLSAADKTYDGTTAAEITGEPELVEDKGTVGLLGAIRNFLVRGGAVEDGDEVYVEYGQAAFANPNAGEDKTVSFTGFSLSGNAASNYELTGQPENVTADINPKEATVTANNQEIKEGGDIDRDVTQAVLDGAPQGHSLSEIKFDANTNSGSIRPFDAVILDASGQDVTGNYRITYNNGTLTVQAAPTPTPEPTETPDPSVTPEPTETPDPSVTPEPTTPPAPGDLTADTAISVSGLETGDKVSFYQVLQFSPDAVDTGGWVAAPGFTALTTDEIQKILALGEYAPGKSRASEAGIDETFAARIADMAEQTTAKYPAISEVNGTASQANPVPGLYVALIIPGQLGTVYNPIFVGADYTGNNQSDSWKVNLNDSYEPASMAKKGEITLTKTASTADGNPDGVSAGDLVTFTLTTKIPEYGNDYTSAVFKVTDTLSSGLELQTGTINVYKDSANEANLLAAADEYSAGKAYKLSKDTSADDTFTVDFFTQYILGLDAAEDIVITYQAVVTTSAPVSVNLEKNTATVNYSNRPTDGTGNGTLQDETKHYTFDIDANILGDDSWKTTEVVKVGLDASGKEITEVTLHEGQSAGALEGAEFKLYVPVNDGTHEFKDSEGNAIFTEPYTNSILTSGKTIVSDGTGRLTIQGETLPGIRGLDLGTYYLVEEKAPTGYVKCKNAVKVEILAPDDAEHWETKTYEEERNGYSYTWDVKELKKYEVRINGVKTAEYTFINEDEDPDTLGLSTDTAVKGDTVTGKESEGYIGRPGATANAGAGKIVNTHGANLPATGGPGTMYYYLVGVFLLIFAGTGFMLKRGRV